MTAQCTACANPRPVVTAVRAWWNSAALVLARRSA